MKKNIWLLLAVSISFLFLFSSYIPNFYEVSIAKLLPAERVMTPAEHMYTYDYNVYLSKIKQGMDGRWSVVDKYDNNPNQKGVYLQMLYLLSGKVGGILNLSPGSTFHLLRTVLSSIWIFTIIYLCFYMLSNSRTAFFAVLLSLFAASWPVFYQYQGTTWIGMHMSWWQELDVLKRISYIPHYTLNYIIISVLSLLLASYSKNFQFIIINFKSILKLINLKFNKNFAIKISNFHLICLILFFSFFIHPSSGLLFLISWVLFHFLNLIVYKKYDRYWTLKIIYDSVILFLIAALPLIYFQFVTSSYPWKSLIDFDKFNRYPVNVKEYVLALGPVFYTGIFGLILALLKKEQKLLPLVTWILGAFLAIFAFKKFPLQSELRFVQTANHIPLTILSVYFLEKLIKWKAQMPFLSFLRSRPADKAGEGVFLLSEKNGIKLSKVITNFVVFVIIVGTISLGIAQSYFSIKSQTDFIHQRVVAGQPLVPYPPQVMYPLKDMFNTFIWLAKNTKNEDVVLSHVYAGNYIPAYSGNFVYLGHNPETPHYDERVKKLELFYSGTLSDKDAEKFLKEERIKYILYGPQEKQKSVEIISKYGFLQQVYQSNFVTLFRVD